MRTASKPSPGTRSSCHWLKGRQEMASSWPSLDKLIILYPATSGKYGWVYVIAIEDNPTSLESEITLFGITEARIWDNVIQ